MEDWQQWQIRADQIAAELGQEIDGLVSSFGADAGGTAFRAFWPRFRDLKERVRTAPAIKLDDKLRLESRLRELGARAYRSQEAAFSRSQERKDGILPRVVELRSAAERTESTRDLRDLRRDLDGVRKQFDEGDPLVPADRQVLWDTWREASQYVWQRLTTIWELNEEHLKSVLNEARELLEQRDADGARRAVGRFFDALKTHEGRQNTVASLKAQANEIRHRAGAIEADREAHRVASQAAQNVSPLDGWRSDLDRNRETAVRLSEEIGTLEEEFKATRSVLEQAMIRGTLVDKKRKLSDVERANRTLVQRIEQAEEAPVLTTL